MQFLQFYNSYYFRRSVLKKDSRKKRAFRQGSYDKWGMETVWREVDDARRRCDECLRNMSENQCQNRGNPENRSQDQETAAHRSGIPLQGPSRRHQGSLLARRVLSYSVFSFLPSRNSGVPWCQRIFSIFEDFLMPMWRFQCLAVLGQIVPNSWDKTG